MVFFRPLGTASGSTPWKEHALALGNAPRMVVTGGFAGPVSTLAPRHSPSIIPLRSSSGFQAQAHERRRGRTTSEHALVSGSGPRKILLGNPAGSVSALAAGHGFRIILL